MSDRPTSWKPWVCCGIFGQHDPHQWYTTASDGTGWHQVYDWGCDGMGHVDCRLRTA